MSLSKTGNYLVKTCSQKFNLHMGADACDSTSLVKGFPEMTSGCSGDVFMIISSQCGSSLRLCSWSYTFPAIH